MKSRLGPLCALLVYAGCGGTTGGGLVQFQAQVAGPEDAVAGMPLVFTNALGYEITIEKATLHIGALYLNQTVPTSGAQGTSCILPGIYVAEAFSSQDPNASDFYFDLLSPMPKPLLLPGQGIKSEAKAGEIWLNGLDIDAEDDPTPILNVAGKVMLSGTPALFSAILTIGKNRARPIENPALPGSSPICKQRIVTPILLDILPTNGGTLTLRVDPRGMFAAVDFQAATPDSVPIYRFEDTPDGSQALYDGLRANAGVYTFTWSP